MAELRKINEFIDLIRKNRVNENHGFKNFADRLYKLLSVATNAILTQITLRIAEILKSAVEIFEKYASIPIENPIIIRFNSNRGITNAGSTQLFSKLFEFNFSSSPIYLKSATLSYNCLGISIKVSLPLKFKLFFELCMQKPDPKRVHKNKHKNAFLKTENKVAEPKPIFKPEEVQAIFDLLKNFFSEAQQPALYKILKTGNDISEPLLFLDYGNRLADAFKQLINAGIITGCEKKELEYWIFKNFRYRNNRTFKGFSPRYLSDIISSNNDVCSNPILNVNRDKATGNISIKKA